MTERTTTDDYACRVCEGRNVEVVLELGAQPHCNSLLTQAQLDRREPHYPLDFAFCHACTTAQITYTVPKEEMFSEYVYVSGTTGTLRAHFEDSAARLTQRLGLDGDLVVDIGSNDGTWLKAFQSHGAPALGVEPARNIASEANAAGVPTINDFFNADVARRIRAEYGEPALVTAAGVFFHLEELHSATEGVAELLEGGGTFCVQAIYLREMVVNNEFDNIYHEHLTYWTLRSISELLDRHGLAVWSADVVPIHGGSLELLVCKKGTREVEESVRAMLAAEREERLGEVGTYRAWADRVWTARDRLLDILGEYQPRGRTVHALGAPAKGATLLNSFGITPDLVETSVERNPLKIGLWIPGARIPIVAEGSIPAPDAYLVLPWNFLRELLGKFEDYIRGGGAFIVPVPEPKVIDASNYDEEVERAKTAVTAGQPARG